MLDKFRTRVANWIAPERPVPNVPPSDSYLQSLEQEVGIVRKEADTLRSDGVVLRLANSRLNNQIEEQRSKLVVAGLKIGLMKKALATSRGYVLDALDDARSTLDALPSRSKKRVQAQVLVATVEKDAEELHAAMADTKTPVAA